MSSPNCRHIKEDGAYCASPALHGRKYCHFHLTHRGRRFRRALALSRNEPCPLVLPPLEDLSSVPVALSEILQALAAGQLDQRTAGKMLYAIQQATTVFLRVADMKMKQQALAKSDDANLDREPASTPAQEYPDFERNFGLQPGIDLDAEIDRVSQQAQEQAAILSIMPTPQPGSGCPVPPKPYYTREESYQLMQWEIKDLRKKIREFQEERNRQLIRKPPASATPAAKPVAETA